MSPIIRVHCLDSDLIYKKYETEHYVLRFSIFVKCEFWTL